MLKKFLCITALFILLINLAHTKEDQMSKNVLVTYSTVAGSTTEIAQFIANTLSENGFNVECLHTGNVNSVKDYDLVIIGSPIYMGSWRKESKNFVTEFQNDLNETKTAFFLTCLALNKEKPDFSQIEKYLEKERNIVNPISEGRFKGKMDYSKLSFMHKLVAKMVGAKEGDFREWDEIKSWTEGLVSLLNNKE